MENKLPPHPTQKRCNQCDHLESFHGDSGCECFQLGVRAVPLYKCACVKTKAQIQNTTEPMSPKFPTITSGGTGFSFPIIFERRKGISVNFPAGHSFDYKKIDKLHIEDLAKNLPSATPNISMKLSYLKYRLINLVLHQDNYTPEEEAELTEHTEKLSKIIDKINFRAIKKDNQHGT